MPCSPQTVDVEAAQPCLLGGPATKLSAKDSLLFAGPPRLQRSLTDAFLCSVGCQLLKYAVGILLSALVIAVLVAILPVLLLGQLISKLRESFGGQNAEGRRWKCGNCNLWFPLEGSENKESVGVFVFHSNIDAVDLCSHLSEGFQLPGVEKFFHSHTHLIDVARQRISTWDQRQIRLETADDLHHLLNKVTLPGTSSQVPSHLSMIPNFVFNQSHGSCSLCLLRCRTTREEPLCLFRLFTVLSRARSTFDVDPKIVCPLTQRVLVFWYFSHKLAQFIKCICVGPLNLLLLFLRETSPVWKYLAPELDRTSSVRRTRDCRVSEDHQMLMSVPMTYPSERALCWGPVPYHDELQRSERVLRTSPIELQLALLAGALRTHFREQGIKHPPDLSCAFPCSMGEHATVEASRSCDTVLLPIYLPTGVEGCIPRIWATQRRVSNAVNGCLPMTLKGARKLVGLTFSSKLGQKLCSSFYKSCGVLVTVIKAKGELQVQSGRLQHALVFPSLPNSVQIAFTFIQCGTETMLGISANRTSFPNPTRILELYQEEIHNLVDQLSLRLMTFQQTTVLPMRFCPSPFGFSGDISPVPSACTRSPSTLQSHEVPPESDEMMRSLETLLQEVQEELDELSSQAVEGNRGHYIEKLKDLEKRMGIFHERLCERIESSMHGDCKIGFDADRASDTIANLLETYRQPSPSISGRRFSREFVRTDSLPRKFSRT